jgi:RecA-family ATPase
VSARKRTDALTAESLARQIDVLIIDPFVSSHEVEENANSQIDEIAKAWGRVARAANCAIVLVHQTSKAGAAEVTALSARGAVAR